MAKQPTAEERRHLERIRKMGCLVCGARASAHHVTGYADRMGRFSRSHKLIVPLCGIHHQIIWGPKESVEALGHRGFFYTYGIDLLAEAKRLWAESEERQAA